MLRLDMLSEADRLVLEKEHARLESFLCDLHAVCSHPHTSDSCHHACGNEKMAACQGRLTSFLYDFLDLVAEHFENEEEIMRSSMTAASHLAQIDSHRQEHARLMHEVGTMVQEASDLNKRGDAAAAIKRISSKIIQLFGEHARVFDSAL
jgi:hemerythrin